MLIEEVWRKYEMNNHDNLLYFLKVLISNYFRTLQIYNLVQV